MATKGQGLVGEGGIYEWGRVGGSHSTARERVCDSGRVYTTVGMRKGDHLQRHEQTFKGLI